MDPRILRPQQYICRSCLKSLRRELHHELLLVRRRPLSQATNTYNSTTISKRYGPLGVSSKHSRYYGTTSQSPAEVSKAQPVDEVVQKTLDQRPIPSDEQVLNALHSIEAAALKLCVQDESNQPSSTPSEASPTSAMLSLNGRTRSNIPHTELSTKAQHRAKHLSLLAYRLMENSRIFITPEALKSYVNIQSIFTKPQTFPKVFQLYATKPHPQATESDNHELSYRNPSPDAAKSAIPAADAYLALDSAIHVRNLPLALSIISESFQKRAFRKAKFIRKGLGPVIGATLTPFAAWVTASNLSEIQTGLPSETFTQIAFAGFATYAATVGTIGYVALTSANDQMQRVTWAVGTPLRERWMREEERAALDRVACAWGFKDRWQWGEEEGRDWQDLKEWIGLRGMVLDKVGLMEGME